MLKRRILPIFLIVILVFMSNFAYADINITAKSALLMDYSTGKIIYSLNEHTKVPPASITKIMTLLLTMESLNSSRINLEDKVYISEHSSSMGGSTVYLEAGESQRVEDLIKAVALRSANDASVALAEYIGGSEESFVKLMNERARELGMENTNFTNASGLPNKDLYTTAYDIGLMSRELMKYEKVQDYLKVYMEDLPVGKAKKSIQTMVNTNRLVRDYEGTNGIKTGSTNDAGYCISASAKRDNLHLIAVVMGLDNSKIRFDEAKKLLDYGFANYETLNIGKEGDLIATIPVEKGNIDSVEIVLERDSYGLLPKGNKSKVEKEVIYPEFINAPVEIGSKVGEMIIKMDNVEIDRINLITRTKVNKGNFTKMLKKTIKNFITGK